MTEEGYVMNKKRIKNYIIITLMILEAITLTLTCKSYGNKMLENIKEEHKIDRKRFSMYIEKEDGTFESHWERVYPSLSK